MAVLMRLRAELRSSWRSWAGLVVLVGVVGALVLAAVAGARRTETAFPRALETANLTDGGLPIGSKFGFADLTQEQIRRLPDVEEVYRGDGFFFDGRTDKGRHLENVDLNSSPDPRYGDTVDGVKIIAGRKMDAKRPNEAVVDEYAATQNGLEVGDTFTVRFAAASQLDAALKASHGGGPFRPTGARARFEVVGIAASFEAPSADPGSFRSIQVSSAFDRASSSRIAQTRGFLIDLKHGEADIPSFKRRVERLAKGQRVNFFSIGDFGGQVRRTTHIQAASLWILAALGALVALLVVAQALARQTQLEAVEYSTLRALGMSRSQLLATILTRIVAIGILGAVLAGAGAFALSPLTPVGALARKAEPNPGLSFDFLVIGVGMAAIVVLLLAVTALPAWRAARRTAFSPDPGETDRTSRRSVADRLARIGLRPAAVAGVRMALESGRGRTAVPVRTAIAGVVLALAAIAAALTFAASLDRLTTTPRLYGQTWDAQIGGGDGPDRARAAFPILRDRTVGAFSAGTLDEVSIRDKRVGVLAMDAQRGSIAPSVIDGRAPSAPDEVNLATKSLDAVGADLGDVVTLSVGSRSMKMRVVGRCVMPDFSIDSVVLGKGAFMTFAGYRRLVPHATRNTFLVRFAAGTDKKVALGRLSKVGDASLGVQPTDLANFSRVDSMPFVIGGVLGTAALATLVHTLLSSVRRRRRELAILKTLGFERGQVSRAVAWQATTITAIAVLIGIPLGIAAGRWAWTIFSDELGVVPEAVVPTGYTLLVLPAALILANLIAALPARMAGRTPPALALRSE
jgi:ABC-type lipoprotein release transport system permease subunit